jgi:hypothetical protein
MLKCKYCGWDLPEDARVCAYCGHTVEPEDDEQKRRFKLKWHLSALAIGMNAPKSAFLLSTAKTSSARPPAALVVFLISTLVLVNIVVIGTLRPHGPQNGSVTSTPISVTFIPHTSVDPTLIDFGMVEIGSKAVLTVMIKTNDTAQFRLEVASGNAQWLSIALQSETKEHNNLRDIIYDVTANTSSLKVGQYSVTIAIKSGGGPPQQVPVKIQVIPQSSPLPAEIHISPQLLDFGAQNVGSQAMLPLTVSNNGGQKLNWSADQGQIPWLTLDTSSGSITPGGHPQIINVRVDTTTLTKGQHSTSINFTSNGGHASVNAVLNVVFRAVNGPAVSNITPSSGPEAGGTPVTITGSGFTNVSGVSFGSSPATHVTLISDTQITAVSPAGTGIVDVTVTTPNGTSNSVQFTYIPIVKGIDPNSGPAVGSQINMFITGTGFTGATNVLFGSKNAEFAVINDTQIRVYYFPGGSGIVDVTVTTPNGTSNSVQFTYIPTVRGIDPNIGPVAGGTPVTITGSGFGSSTNGVSVSFGGTLATSTSVSDTQITAVSPAGTGIVDVTVTTPNGTSNAVQFTYIPTVTGIDPNSGPAAGGDIIMYITGIGFTGAKNVLFGSKNAKFEVISDTQIRVYYFPGGSGTVDVTVTTPNGTSATSPADVFTYIPPPIVKGINPNSGPAAGGTTVYITGSGFGSSTNGVSVSFGGTPATITSVSDTQITVTSPAGTGTVDVTVITQNGTSATSPADLFTYQ